MTITTVDDIAAGLAASKAMQFSKNLAVPKVAGAFVSSWTAAGFPGAGSASPLYTAGSGYTCDKDTPGAIPLTNAVIKNYLAKISASSSQIGTLMLVDRLWSCSGMGFAAGTYTVTTPGSLPARITDNGVSVEAWVENFVAAGSATGTLTLNYKNTVDADSSGVIATVQSAPSAAQLQMIPLQTSDLGVKQITSVVTSNTWTSGSFGISLIKRIAEIPLPSIGASGLLDWAQSALEQVPNDACLMLVWRAFTTQAPQVTGSINLIDK